MSRGISKVVQGFPPRLTPRLIEGGQLWAACAGDCRLVLARGDVDGDVTTDKLKAITVTRDLKVEDPAEAARLTAAGGQCTPGIDTEEEFEPPRVYEDVSRRYRGPGLAISRAVGDMNARSCGVVATPEVSSMQLQPSDCFLILASDGVWEFISSAEAVEIVRPFFEAEEPASVACTYLIAKAAYKWREVEGDYRDDISAIVVYLPLFDD